MKVKNLFNSILGIIILSVQFNINTLIMTVLEKQLLERVPNELHQLNELLQEIINLIKSKDNGTDCHK